MAQTIKTVKKIILEEGVFSFIKKSIIYIQQLIVMPYYLIRCKYKHQRTIEDSVNYAFNSIGGILTPAQVKTEISYLLSKIANASPKTIMEVGTGKGGNLFLLCNAAPDDCTIIALDMRGGAHGAGYPPWKIPLLRSFAKPEQELILINANSHKIETQNIIENTLDGSMIDVLFIDGDHSYEGVKRDFNLYSPFVRPGGLIILHDIVDHLADPTCQVNLFWKELKQIYPHEEIIENKNQTWAGIGVIQKQ